MRITKSKTAITLLRSFMVLLLLLIAGGFVIGGSACQKPSETPLLLINPTVSKLQVGQNLGECIIKGGCNTAGEFRILDESFAPDKAGKFLCEWEFIPHDKKNFTKLSGNIIVEFFNHKLSFEENGGFEIEDVFFNQTYTLDEKPLTAKNEYNFRGWTQTESDDDWNFINYPYEFSNSKTLYAKYLFHSVDVLYYAKGNISELGHDDSVHVMRGLDIEYRMINNELIIADMYEDLFVESIATFNNQDMTTVILSNYTTQIGGNTFGGCDKLEYIFIPRYIRYIGEFAFQTCTALKTVEFEDPYSESKFRFGDFGSFYWCTSLTSINLPTNTAGLPDEIFHACASLTEITIPMSVKTIGDGAFALCMNLKTINFECAELELIEKYAFLSCNSLEKIEIPAKAKVNYKAFYGCNNLNNIILTQNQIRGIAHDIHNDLIGTNDEFEIIFDVNADYTDTTGEYIADTEGISLHYAKFSILTLYVLAHEIYHHYQFAAVYGVGDETLQTLATPPTAKQLKNWAQDYISYETDPEGNWNHPLEIDAREFAKSCTGLEIGMP